jgi:hypothetical protein
MVLTKKDLYTLESHFLPPPQKKKEKKTGIAQINPITCQKLPLLNAHLAFLITRALSLQPRQQRNNCLAVYN